ncbi:sulfite exporter TauE/SafE family protein [Noviherbaspirillum aridicola]|uniref:Probable membrane transporter protein n=1 Tax=Noviherbaspirillum aridicola TaxID=2849687 RepID=A0ABQ4Q7H0_9BURK|nr:sulfite exporter TauE/SafE family protein [Noviherbaspirillum aridicola]GIZ53145.1 UPF0721 transmembrane protein [Noviherbaspirillum aridicola]
MSTMLALGATVGLIMALTGAGGGILAVPLLVFGTGLAMPAAAPVALLAVGLAAALGAVLGLGAGIVRYRAAFLIAAAGAACAPLGVWLAGRVDGTWLGFLFAFVLFFVALRAWRQASASPDREPRAGAGAPPCVTSAATGRFLWSMRCTRALAGAGSLAGLLSGLLGVGGGFVVVPAMGRYTSLAMESIVATSLAVIALVSVSGVASSMVAGRLDWGVALPFSAGALAGMLAGRRAAARLAGAWLQKGFAAVSAVVAARMLFDAFAWRVSNFPT